MVCEYVSADLGPCPYCHRCGDVLEKNGNTLSCPGCGAVRDWADKVAARQAIRKLERLR
jgi:exosome complex RNA-binding protein Csl4